MDESRWAGAFLAWEIVKRTLVLDRSCRRLRSWVWPCPRGRRVPMDSSHPTADHRITLTRFSHGAALRHFAAWAPYRAPFVHDHRSSRDAPPSGSRSSMITPTANATRVLRMRSSFSDPSRTPTTPRPWNRRRPSRAQASRTAPRAVERALGSVGAPRAGAGREVSCTGHAASVVALGESSSAATSPMPGRGPRFAATQVARRDVAHARGLERCVGRRRHHREPGAGARGPVPGCWHTRRGSARSRDDSRCALQMRRVARGAGTVTRCAAARAVWSDRPSARPAEGHRRGPRRSRRPGTAPYRHGRCNPARRSVGRPSTPFSVATRVAGGAATMVAPAAPGDDAARVRPEGDATLESNSPEKPAHEQ